VDDRDGDEASGRTLAISTFVTTQSENAMFATNSNSKKPSKLVLSKDTVRQLTIRSGIKGGTACSMNMDCTTISAVENCLKKSICCPPKMV
jgi:hypothetical protein